MAFYPLCLPNLSSWTSLSSYRGQLVVDENTKEPTGLRYKDDHLYDDDGHDLGSFSDLGNFYPNR